MSDALTVRLTATEAARVYETAMRDIREACAKIHAAERLLQETFVMNSSRYIYVDTHRLSFNDPNRALAELRSRVWEKLIERLDIRRVMSVSRAQELDRMIREHTLPEITEQAVLDLAASFHSQVGDMQREAVSEVFEFLRPHRNEHKTNTEFEIGKRVVLTTAVTHCKYTKRFEVNTYAEKVFTALENVFATLDGAGMTSRGYRSDLQNALQKSADGCFETTYFRGRAFKNSNVHIEFLRPDLVARLNQIAGGNRLKPEGCAR